LTGGSAPVSVRDLEEIFFLEIFPVKKLIYLNNTGVEATGRNFSSEVATL